MSNLVEVPLDDLLRVLPFKGSDDLRYYLNGVLVTPHDGGALLVATNGHWMAIYESKAARTDKDRILDLPQWFARQIFRMEKIRLADDDDDESEDLGHSVPVSASEAPKQLSVADEGAHLVITQLGRELLVKPDKPFVDGKFPEWRKVVPDPATLELGIFSPVSPYYLARLQEAIPRERNHPLFAYHARNQLEKAVVFRVGNMPLVICLMPRRDPEAEPKEWPAWMKPAQQEAAS